MAVTRQARSRSQYDNESHGREDSSLPPGNRIYNTELTKLKVVFPSSDKGPTIIRPWPCLDYKDPSQIIPGRATLHPKGVSEFCIRVTTAQMCGLPDRGHQRLSWILYEPWLAQQKREGNPLMIMFFALKSALKQAKNAGNWDLVKQIFGQHGDITAGKTGKAASFSGPRPVWLMQGEVFFNGDKDYCTGNERRVPLGMDPSDDLVVIQISGASGDRYMELLDTPKPNIDADYTAEPWKAFRFGDPTGVPNANGGVDGGSVVYLFNPKKTRVQDVLGRNGKIPCAVINNTFMPLVNTGWDGKLTDDQRKSPMAPEPGLLPSYKAPDGTVYTATMTPDRAQRVRDKWQFWWDDPNTSQKGLLRVPSVEEQCEYIAHGFHAMRKMLEYAWSDHREFFSDGVRAILNERRSEVVPDGMPAGNGQAAPPARNVRRTDPTQRAALAPPPAEEFDQTYATDDTAAPGGEEFDQSSDYDQSAEYDQSGGPDGFEEVGQEVPTAVSDFPDDVQAAAEGAGDEGVVTADADAGEFQDAAGEEMATEEAVPGQEPEFVDDGMAPVDGTDDGQAPEVDDAAQGFEVFDQPAETDAGEAPAELEPAPEPVAAAAPAAAPTEQEQRMRNSMAAAQRRAAQRVSVQAPPAARPAATTAARPPARPPAASGKPATPQTPAKPQTAPRGAAKPPVAAPKPAPARPAAATAPKAPPARPAAAAAKPQPAAKPAGRAPAARPAAAARRK